jgi:two-component system chemotaxis response regulator CheB
MNYRHLDLISDRTGNPEVIRLFDGVFWVAQGKERSAAVWISAHSFEEGDWDRAFQILQKEVGTPLGFKAVGTSMLLTPLANWLEGHDFKLLNKAVREGGFELRFFPKESKIKVLRKLRVVVVDDSKTIRTLLTKIFNSDPSLEVVGSADRPSAAFELIKTLKPDVITLDVEMPEQDGVSFLKEYLKTHPIPTVMVSSLSLEDGLRVLQALEAGAVDYMQKPTAEELAELSPILIEKVKSAAGAKVKAVNSAVKLSKSKGRMDSSCLVAIGSSTGGVEALRLLLTSLPEEIPPVVITQHIPAVFSKAFADRINSLCPFNVVEATHGMAVLPGTVYIAPGGKQMQIRKRPDHGLQIVIDDSPPVNRHKPSVDHLFDSVVKACGGKCIGVILTGMGADGAAGLLKLRKAGARTIAQDEASCAVFGMPKEAIRLNAAQEVLPIGEIAQKLIDWLS